MVSNFESGIALLSWLISNITIILVNKWSFSNMSFNYPFTLIAWHMVCCTIGTATVVHLTSFRSTFKKQSTDFILQKIFPLAAMFVFNTVLGTFALQRCSVSLMQTIKSLVPLWNLILQKGRGQPIHNELWLTMIPIVGGIVIASGTEGEWDTIGAIAAFLSSVLTAISSLATDLVLQKSMDSFSLLYYMSPMSILMMLPLSLQFEIEGAVSNLESDTSFKLMILMIGGCLAFSLNYTTLLVIAKTSALTFHVAANAKVVFVLVISWIMFPQKLSFFNAMGCFLTAIGVAYYNYLKTYKFAPPKIEIPKDQSQEGTATSRNV